MDIDSSDEESRYRIYQDQQNNNNRSSPVHHARQSSGLATLCGKGLMRRITGNRPTSSYISNSNNYTSKGVQSYPDSDTDSSEDDDGEITEKDRPISFFDPVSVKFIFGLFSIYSQFFKSSPSSLKSSPAQF